MDRETERELIDELLGLKRQNAHFLDASVTRNPVSHYLSEARFHLEREKIFLRLPVTAAHASEMAAPGDFLRRDLAGRSVLLTRDKYGVAHAFLNVCRHRGTRLVDEEAGCKHRFSCPYHAWTYANSGELIAAPHFDEGFDSEDKADFGLQRLPCTERFGMIWVALEDGQIDFDDHFAPLTAELDALGMDAMCVAHANIKTHKANWKILAEGGIEAYHFKVAHRDTIGPYFEDNMSSYRMFGAHMRSILMRTTMAQLTAENRDEWRLRDHAQVLYTLFPTTTFLVQSDHISWVQAEPVSAGETRMRVATLVPEPEVARTDHWHRNHLITTTTLDEDFTIGESIQSTLESGANHNMVFGRFEGALNAFNRVVDSYVSDPAS